MIHTIYFILDKYTVLFFFFFFTMLIPNVNWLNYKINPEGIFFTMLIYTYLTVEFPHLLAVIILYFYMEFFFSQFWEGLECIPSVWSKQNGSTLKLVIQLNQNKDNGSTWAYKVNKLLEHLNKTMIQCHNTLQVRNTNNVIKNANKYMCTIINTNSNSFL